MNVEPNIIKIIEEMQLRLFQHLKVMGSDRISKLYWIGMQRSTAERGRLGNSGWIY